MKRVGSLKGQPYNPPTRTESASLAALVRSIKENGILVPLLINSRDELIDGHRRYAAAKVLRLGEVPCVMTGDRTKESTAKVFEQVNTSQKKLGARDMIYVYVNGGDVPARVQNSISRLEALIGGDELDKVSTMYISYRIIDEIQRIAEFCRRPRDDEFKRKTFWWIINTVSLWTAMTVLHSGITPREYADAILNDKPFKRGWVPEKKGRK